jgi:hypothetical protein
MKFKTDKTMNNPTPNNKMPMPCPIRGILSCMAYVIVVAAALQFATSPVNAVLLAYDPFTNAPGTAIIGSDGGFGFSEAWQANGSGSGTVAYYTNFGLGYVDSMGNVLQTSGNAGLFRGDTAANNSFQGNRAFNFTNGLVAQTTWISLLMIRQGPTNTSVNNPYPRGVNVTFDYPASNTGTNQRVGIGNASGAATNTVGILSAGGNIRPSTNPPCQFGGVDRPITNFIILRVDQTAGYTLDNAYLWVNPTNLAVEPSTTNATANVLGLYDYTMNRWRVFAGGYDSGNSRPYGEVIVDELRIGETWADVTPFTPGGSVGGPARFTNIQPVGNSISLTFTGAVSSSYTILGSTNVATPITNVLRIVPTDGNGVGTFTDTNALINSLQKFYRTSQ